MRIATITTFVLTLAVSLAGGCGKEEKARSRPRPKTEAAAPEPTKSATSRESESASAELPPGHPPLETPSLPPGHPPLSAPPAQASATPIESGPVNVAGLTLTPQAGWNAETPSSQMRVAQFALPGDAGAASLVVYYFGVGQGGGAAANIDRWVGQFKNPTDASKPAESESNVTERDGLTISFVRVNGTYAPSPMGPMAPAEPPAENAALLGYIIEGAPGGSVFVKVTGPAQTIDTHADAVKAFVDSATRS